jgi:hypothetical protein
MERCVVRCSSVVRSSVVSLWSSHVGTLAHRISMYFLIEYIILTLVFYCTIRKYSTSTFTNSLVCTFYCTYRSFHCTYDYYAFMVVLFTVRTSSDWLYYVLCSTTTATLGGPVEKMLFFQIVHTTKVSTQIHSYISVQSVHGPRVE